MLNNILIVTVISLLVAFLFIKKQSALIQTMTEQIPKTINFVDTTPPPPPEIGRTVRKKNYITINGNTNVITYDFNRTLHDVKNIELISAIIPKSNYRINDTNNILKINANSVLYTIHLNVGVYQNISDLLLEINSKIFINMVSPVYTGNYFVVALDNMSKKLFFFTDIPDDVYMDFSGNTCARLLGIGENNVLNITSTTPPAINDYIDTSVYYLTSTYTDGSPVNNLPAAYYATLNIFPTIGTDYTMGGWKFATSYERVNISQQLYMDVTIDNITYWDGTDILQKIFIDETSSVTNYNRQYPSYRTLSENMLKLDKITLRFFSIVDDTRKVPYEFNGLDYSLQLEIVTKNKELNI